MKALITALLTIPALLAEAQFTQMISGTVVGQVLHGTESIQPAHLHWIFKMDRTGKMCMAISTIKQKRKSPPVIIPV